MVAIIPRRFRVPIAIVVGLVGILVMFTSYTRWQDGPFYGSSFNALRAFCGLVVLLVASHVYRHQDD